MNSLNMPERLSLPAFPALMFVDSLITFGTGVNVIKPFFFDNDFETK
jgi:hypothetical protein